MGLLLRKSSIALLAIVGLLFSGCGGNSGKNFVDEEPNNSKQSFAVSPEKPVPYSNDYLASAPPTYRTPQTSESSMPTSATAAGDWGAISVFGEVAPRNFRGSATYGTYTTDTQRFKLSGEYLTQKLNFDFASGDTKKWVSQFAVGAEYQFLLNSSLFKSIELGTAYNHAFHRSLDAEDIALGSVKRRISGSNASLSFVGTTMRLWTCAFLSAAAEYDWVQFNRVHQHDKLSNGFGGSVDFVQQFGKDFALNLGAEFRQPFNAYQALLHWNHRFSHVNLDIGVFGNLTDGHDGVRDIRTVGLQLGLTFGPKPKSCGRCPNMSSSGYDCYARQYCDVSQWASKPAVYVPVVLVVADPATVLTVGGCPPGGSAPTLSGFFIPDITVIGPGTSSGPTSLAFNSSLPLTYTLTVTLTDPFDHASIDPATGVITLLMDPGSNGEMPTGTVTATSSCGSVSAPVNLFFKTM